MLGVSARARFPEHLTLRVKPITRPSDGVAGREHLAYPIPRPIGESRMDDTVGDRASPAEERTARRHEPGGEVRVLEGTLAHWGCRGRESYRSKWIRSATGRPWSVLSGTVG